MRAAAADLTGPLSVKAYEAHQQQAGGPTYARIIQRLGSWNAALARAGDPVEVVRGNDKCALTLREFEHGPQTQLRLALGGEFLQ